jgi:hypothetical protein
MEVQREEWLFMALAAENRAAGSFLILEVEVPDPDRVIFRGGDEDIG